MHPIEKNKKFYILYWMRIFLFYREYVEYSKIKYFLEDIKDGKNPSFPISFTFEKVPHSFYDTIMNGIVEITSKLFKQSKWRLE